MREELEPPGEHCVHAPCTGKVQVGVEVRLTLTQPKEVPRWNIPLHQLLEQIVERCAAMRDE